MGVLEFSLTRQAKKHKDDQATQLGWSRIGKRFEPRYVQKVWKHYGSQVIPPIWCCSQNLAELKHTQRDHEPSKHTSGNFRMRHRSLWTILDAASLRDRFVILQRVFPSPSSSIHTLFVSLRNVDPCHGQLNMLSHRVELPLLPPRQSVTTYPYSACFPFFFALLSPGTMLSNVVSYHG